MSAPLSSATRLYPATAILINEKGDWENRNLSIEQARKQVCFCYKAILNAIDLCQKGLYSHFDAHTSSNCCHGMALLAKRTIQDLKNTDFQSLTVEGTARLAEANSSSFNPKNQSALWHVSERILDLARLYILKAVCVQDPDKGGRTDKKQLEKIFPVSAAFNEKLIDKLQHRFSNLVASSYHLYARELGNNIEISGAPVSDWGNYVNPEYLRIDHRNIHYASCMYSMQVVLAHLSVTTAKIAVINDLKTKEGDNKGRFTQLIQGNGNGEFNLIEDQGLETLDPAEPILVFGGTTYSDEMDLEHLKKKMNPWLYRFSHLVLACDVHYPQFPAVPRDPNFDSKPILPKELRLQEIIAEHTRIEGTSAQNPSLYCLNHVYPASIGQVLAARKEINPSTLPSFNIPEKLLQKDSVSIDSL